MNERLLRAWVRELLIEKRSGVGGKLQAIDTETIRSSWLSDPESPKAEDKKTKPLSAKKKIEKALSDHGTFGASVQPIFVKTGGDRGKEFSPASGAYRFKPSGGVSAKDSWKDLLKAFRPSQIDPKAPKNYHSSKYETIKLSVPDKRGTVQTKYVVWDTGGTEETPAILTDQQLGYICEWALAAAVNVETWPPKKMETDNRVSAYYTSSPVIKAAVDAFANLAMDKTKEASKILNSIPAIVGQGGTDIVDVTLKGGQKGGGIDCHVKFNDTARLIGLQKLKGESRSPITQDLLDAIANKEPHTALPVNMPAASKWKLNRDEFARKIYPKRSINDLTDEEELALYSDHRAEFLEFLEGTGVREALEDRLKAFLIQPGEQGKIYFCLYGGSASQGTADKDGNILSEPTADVTLVVKEVVLSIDNVYVEARTGVTDTYLYSVKVITDEDNPDCNVEVAKIEMRTAGQKHPPQIKNVKPEPGPTCDDTKGQFLKQIHPLATTESLIRTLVREMLLTEAFTKTDEDKIGVLSRKEIDKVWKKDREKKVQAMIDKSTKNAYRNDDFYKVVGKIWKELMKVYAEEQFQHARRFTRYDVPLARIRP
jgi:hypothetical protein